MFTIIVIVIIIIIRERSLLVVVVVVAAAAAAVVVVVVVVVGLVAPTSANCLLRERHSMRGASVQDYNKCYQSH